MDEGLPADCLSPNFPIVPKSLNSESNRRCNLAKLSVVLVIGLLLGTSLHAAEPIVPGTRGVLRFAESPARSSDTEQVRARLSALEDPPATTSPRTNSKSSCPRDTIPKSRTASSSGSARRCASNPQRVGSGTGPARPNLHRRAQLRQQTQHLRPDALGDRCQSQHAATLPDRRSPRLMSPAFQAAAGSASMLGVAWGDMFSGTACFMGVNFYTDVQAEDGKLYAKNYVPDEEVAARAKKILPVRAGHGGKGFQSGEHARSSRKRLPGGRLSAGRALRSSRPGSRNCRRWSGWGKRWIFWMRGGGERCPCSFMDGTLE